MEASTKELSVVVPCYNEAPDVLKRTVEDLRHCLSQISGLSYEILVVNDGSTKFEYDLSGLGVTLLTHDVNCGYGASLSTGIRAARYPWIVITDSDGTYPNEDLRSLLIFSGRYDMVLGQRSWREIPAIRRPAKYVLHKFASFMAGQDVMDLNTGMRVFRKSIATKYTHLFPQRFSFTSTLTMICLTSGYRVKAIPIRYRERIGPSSIRPIRDTIAFFSLVLRLSLYFNPLRIFVPLSFAILLGALGRGIRDYWITNALGGMSLVLFFMGFQVFFFGLLAEIVNKRALRA